MERGRETGRERAAGAAGAAQAAGGGFTLVELLVVITIMAVLAGMIVPQFTSTSDDVALAAAGRDLVVALHLAYSEAVTRQAPHRLVVRAPPGEDAAGIAWWIEGPADGGSGRPGSPEDPGRPEDRGSPGGSGRPGGAPGEGPAAGDFAPLRDVPGAGGRLDPRIAARVVPETGDATPARRGRPREPSEGQPESILFRPDGTAEAQTIVLRGRDGFGLALRVDPVTARVRPAKLDREEEP